MLAKKKMSLHVGSAGQVLVAVIRKIKMQVHHCHSRVRRHARYEKEMNIVIYVILSPTPAKSMYEACLTNLECSYNNPNVRCIDFLCYCPLPFVLTDTQQCLPREYELHIVGDA